MSRLRDPLIVTGIAIAVLVAAILAGQAIRGLVAARATAKAETKLTSLQAGSAQASGGDAVNTVASAAADEAASDALTLENDRAIRSAPGAGAPVDPAATAAGLGGLCRRAAYIRDEHCLQFTPAR